MPLNPNTNYTIPQNLNIQEENTQANQTDKPKSNPNIQENNARFETDQKKNQSMMAIPKKGKGNTQLCQMKTTKKT